VKDSKAGRNARFPTALKAPMPKYHVVMTVNTIAPKAALDDFP
jgi:hypothetical protein